VWRQHRQHRWDRDVARSLHTTPAVLPVLASPSPAPAPADQRV